MAGWGRITAVGAWAALVGACALATAAPPEVRVIGVELRGVGLLEQELGVGLCVTNPNRTELAFRGVSFAVDVAGAPLAGGVSDAPVRLPPLASVPVSFTVVVTARNLGPQLLGAARAGGLDYRLRGTVAPAGAPGISLPFGRSGRLGLSAIGQGLLADAVAPAADGRCAVPF